MFDLFVEYVSKAKPDELRALSVEDIAICVAWYQSMGHDSEKRALCQGLEEAADFWVREWEPPNHESEGARQQPLLRALLDEVLGGQLVDLRRDALDFLCIVDDLARRARRSDRLVRPLKVLDPHLDALQRRRVRLAPVVGLPDLSQRMHITAGEEIERARPREVRTLGGIELPCRGPVLTWRGDIKVIDFVPANCTLVVEQGACYVNGFVIGRVLAAKHCEVRENISGVVIVSQGDVRVRNIINNALVVAKSGRVRCRCAHAPKLVFGGKSIWVAESAVRGSYIASRMETGQEIVDAEVQVTESLTAERFSCAKRGTSIVLRKDLYCEDYGEEIKPEARKLIGRRVALRRQIVNLNRMAEFAEQENEHSATSALMFVCGGEKTKRLLEDLQSAQRRLAFLERIIAGLGVVRDSVETGGTADDVSRQRDAVAVSLPMEDLEEEMKSLEAGGELDSDLASEGKEMLALGKGIEKRAPNAKVIGSVLSRLIGKESVWCAERDRLMATIREKDDELRAVVGSLDILDKSESASRVQVLSQLLTLSKQRAAGDELVGRVQSSLVRMLLRAIGVRVERARRYRSAIEQVRGELREIGGQLNREWQIALQDDDAPVRATVVGQFDQGVRFYVDRLIAQDDGPPPPPVVTTPDSGGRVLTYVRTNGNVVQES